MDIGWTFFGWGLLLAVTSVWLAPCCSARFGTVPTPDRRRWPCSPLDLAVMALSPSTRPS